MGNLTITEENLKYNQRKLEKLMINQNLLKSQISFRKRRIKKLREKLKEGKK